MDSTAAPVTTVAVISTWVGFEVGLIQDAMAQLGQQAQAYTFFLQSLPYSYYPILTLLLVYLLSATGRDFGPMLHAERRALEKGQVLRPGAQPAGGAPVSVAGDDESAEPANPWLAGLPILAVILTTALGLYFGGREGALAANLENPSLREVLNHADSFTVLTWASLTGATLAVLLSVAAGRLKLGEAMEGYLEGARAMLIAVTILVLAWSLSAVCEKLDTAGFLVHVSQQVLSARLLPSVVFVLAAAVSFATGTSWGTMAILMPLVYPLGLELPVAAGLAPDVALHIHLASVSAVLAGAVFGDHCSPISDTTIMSSLACGSDHVDHVRTQLPYSLTTGTIAVVFGYLPVGLGVAPWVSLLLGALAIVLVVWRLGKVPGLGSEGERA